jgi:NAD(P)-dependent dehydrogenase (short-subunit alcohol dehydrogenase family)
MEEKPIDRFKLGGKTVVVTGGATGLGQTFAVALADAGARVAVIDRDPMDETAKLLGERGLTVHADLIDAEQVQSAVDQTLKWSGGKADVLVNNAGIASALGRIEEVSADDFDRVVTVNLRSMFLTTKALLPALIASGHGSIIDFSSYLGLVGLYPDFPVTASRPGAPVRPGPHARVLGAVARFGVRTGGLRRRHAAQPRADLVAARQQLFLREPEAGTRHPAPCPRRSRRHPCPGLPRPLPGTWSRADPARGGPVRDPELGSVGPPVGAVVEASGLGGQRSPRCRGRP